MCDGCAEALGSGNADQFEADVRAALEAVRAGIRKPIITCGLCLLEAETSQFGRSEHTCQHHRIAAGDRHLQRKSRTPLEIE